MNRQKKNLAKLIMMLMLLSFSFTSCGDKDSEDVDVAKPQELLIGKWECRLDAYGDPWDEPVIMFFDSDGTGYQWFSDEPFANRWEFNYFATSSNLKIKTKYEDETYELRYKISSNGQSLIIYGFDDNDMEELWFTKVL